jgi:DNA (cytosine-5)-methyltransferase 1
MISYRCFQDGKPAAFGVIGGPPCPDFSHGGLHAGINGKNGRLTQDFVDLICSIKPTFFVLENVTGLIKFKRHKVHFDKILKQLSNEGYETEYRILNALEFGVPQHRERVFLIGFKKSLIIRYRKATLGAEDAWFKWPSNPAYASAASRYSWPKTSAFGSTPAKPRQIPPELCVGSYLVPKIMRSRVPNADSYFKPYSEKFGEVAEGDTSQKSFKRLHRYRYSPTACYGNNEVHLHPWEPRRLSLREAMRIQGIPDSYIIPDNVPLQTAFKLVSNGVPVPLSMNVAKAVRQTLTRLI